MTGIVASRIRLVTLPETGDAFTHDPFHNERIAAVTGLIGNSHFQPLNDNAGPYALAMAIEEHRLVMRVSNSQEIELPTLVLSLTPYRRLIRDYFLTIESYEQARAAATREKLETIDMARRSLHNEGAELLSTRLNDKIDMDFETARRLFTLVCSLHRGKIALV